MSDLSNNENNPVSKGEQQEDTHYHVTVYHTDTLTGAPDLHKEQVIAPNEQQAIKHAKNRPEWPEEEFYDEDKDVGVSRPMSGNASSGHTVKNIN